MKFNIFVNSIIIAVVAVFLVALAFHVKTGTTLVDSIAILKTSGMTCSSCSSKITKALETQHGVSATEVDVNGGWVIVGYDTKTVRPEELALKVTGTGFASNVHLVMTPEQFKQTTGRYLGKSAGPGSGCCGNKGGGCGSGKNS